MTPTYPPQWRTNIEDGGQIPKTSLRFVCNVNDLQSRGLRLRPGARALPESVTDFSSNSHSGTSHYLEPASYFSNVVLFCVFFSLLDLLLLQMTKMNGTEQKGLINKDGLVSST